MADNDLPTRRECGTMEVHERLLRTVPGYIEARAKSENYAMRAAAIPQAGRTGCTVIPVVMHVVYKTAAQNISDAQVQSQLTVLNDDFRLRNADLASAPAPFRSLAGDGRISFELATTDPEGNATDGIVRVKTGKDSFSSTDDDIKAAATDGSDAWPADKYLNIWVGPKIVNTLGQPLLGYAQFPGGPAATDGVVILHSAFGTTGTAAGPFDLGRTTTHEVGHWLNLRHIWGDDGTGCFGDDFVIDTPNQAGPNYGAPAFPHVSCGNAPDGDMFVNYMDYVDDAAMVMFTADQVTRMQAALDSTRSNIGTTGPCGKFIPKDIIKEPIKDPPKDFPKDPPKDFPKDPPKEFHKDPPKDFAKDPPKDFHKDPPKDFHKDPPKDIPKDLPKDHPKDFHKEPIKEFPKDLPFDPPKGVFEPPKGVFEPPKGVFEPPKGFFEPPPKHVFEPPKSVFDPPKSLMEPPIDLGPGGQPFVLGTPATPQPMTGPQFAGGQPYGGAAGAEAQQRQQAAAVAGAYAQLLAHYAQLYASGMLDANGLAAWRQAAQAYQRLLTS